MAVADIAISVARSASTSPVALPVDATRSVSMYRTWFVGDSGLCQCGERALPAVHAVVNETGRMDCFLGMERRAKKYLWPRLKWRGGRSAAARPARFPTHPSRITRFIHQNTYATCAEFPMMVRLVWHKKDH